VGLEAITPPEETTSLCPECFAELDATYVERDGRVHLDRECPEHGEFLPVVWADADHWSWASKYGPDEVATGEDTLNVVNQHACLAVVEVTTQCNLECPFCFASSGHAGEHVPYDEVMELLDVVCDGGGPRPIQLSGGEPTVHDEIVDIVRGAAKRGFEHVEVNTNGVRLAREDGFAHELADAGVSAIYLQFDGFDKATHLDVRDEDLREVKEQAIANCKDAGLPVILVSTVVPGVNDHEVGSIVEYALEHRDAVRSVNLQPLARFGRFDADTDPMSLDAVARRLAEQTGFLEEREFMPVPCCSAFCQAGTALIETDDGAVPLTRFVNDQVFDELRGFVDESDWLRLLAGTENADARTEAAAACCGVGADADVSELADEIMPVGLTGFMDAENADLERLDQCCIGVPTLEDGMVPFCAYNMTTRDGTYEFRRRRGWRGRREVGE
jgi:uncharacterized radical SAM superfamily Fe-S cluster-containing enzyme